MAKVTRATMSKWCTDLDDTISAKEEALGNALLPNDERVEKLEEELSLLEEIQVALQAYIEL